MCQILYLELNEFFHLIGKNEVNPFLFTFDQIEINNNFENIKKNNTFNETI